MKHFGKDKGNANEFSAVP